MKRNLQPELNDRKSKINVMKSTKPAQSNQTFSQIVKINWGWMIDWCWLVGLNNGARWILTEEWMLLNEFWRHNEWIRQRRQPRMNQLKEYWSWWMNWFMAGMNRLLLEWIALQWMRLEWSKKEMISELHELVCLIAN